MLYRAIVSHYLDGTHRPRSEWTTALAAGTREHCLRAALAYGPGAAILRVPDDGALTVVTSDRGEIHVTGNA